MLILRIKSIRRINFHVNGRLIFLNIRVNRGRGIGDVGIGDKITPFTLRCTR